jgi:hypothetical protein
LDSTFDGKVDAPSELDVQLDPPSDREVDSPYEVEIQIRERRGG